MNESEVEKFRALIHQRLNELDEEDEKGPQGKQQLSLTSKP